MANTFDTSRVGGGTYELERDASGNYNLKSVGFTQVNKLNLPDLKTSDTSVANTTKKATEDTIKAQTTEVFKPTNVYQNNGGGGQSYQTMADSKFAKEATVRNAGDVIQSNMPQGSPGQLSKDKARAEANVELGLEPQAYKSPTMTTKENEFAQGKYTGVQTGLQKVQSAVQNTVSNVVDSVKNNKALQMAGTILGVPLSPLMTGAKMVAGMLPKDSPQNTFDRGYFPTNDSGRINTNPATNVFGGMNAVSAFGNVSQGAQKRIDTRNKTSTKLSGAKKENFDAKTKEFEAQKKAYDDKRDNTVPDKGYTRTAVERKANPGRQDANTMSGGSDSAGSGRVICTDLHRTGELSTRDWIRDTKFTFKTLSITHVKGYLLWAEPTVKHMQKYPRYRKMWKHIAQHRANDIAWRLNEGKFDLLGRIYAGIGEPLCWALGNFVSNKQINKYNLTHWRRA
jgi:hypothetical protein